MGYGDKLVVTENIGKIYRAKKHALYSRYRPN